MAAREVDGSRADRREERLDRGPHDRLGVEPDMALGVGIEFGAAGCREATSVECVDGFAECVGSVVRDPGDL
jgi:hypothetical protein